MRYSRTSDWRLRLCFEARRQGRLGPIRNHLPLASGCWLLSGSAQTRLVEKPDNLMLSVRLKWARRLPSVDDVGQSHQLDGVAVEEAQRI